MMRRVVISIPVSPLFWQFDSANLWMNLVAHWRAGWADYFFRASRKASLTPPTAF